MMLKINSGNRLQRFPYWLRQSVRFDDGLEETKNILSNLRLSTICQSARCPNIFECFSNRRCTFLILGRFCTRGCRFCTVENNKIALEEPDKKEIARIIEAVQKLGIQRVIITSVTRDDLSDGGAGYFADCINALKGLGRGLSIEVLVPDFQGTKISIEKVISAKPSIFSHNVETVPRLHKKACPQADYSRSIEVLEYAKQLDRGIITKSGLMVGLGEFHWEIYETMKDLRKAGCDVITIGQYLKPGAGCLDVEEFLKPEDFVKFTEWASDLGFTKYYCGPFVRSSYIAVNKVNKGGIMAELKLPELAEGVNEAVVSFWHFKEGDSIKEGDEIVEMATDKAAFNLPSKVSGILKKIVAEEGDTVEVGGVLAIIQ